MKKLLIALLLFSACEKEHEPLKPAVKPTRVIGQLILTPVGNPSDSFRYELGGSLTVESLHPAGLVSSGPLTFDLVENSMYHLSWLDTLPTDTFFSNNRQDTQLVFTRDKWIGTTAGPMNLSIDLPATVYPY